MSFDYFLQDFEVGQVVTPDQMNQIKDNQEYLLVPNKAVATLASQIISTASAYTDVSGMSVNLTTHGGHVLVNVDFTNFYVYDGSGVQTGYARVVLNGVAYSADHYRAQGEYGSWGFSIMIDESDLVVGVNTIKVQAYRAGSGTGYNLYLGAGSRLEAMEV